MSTHMPGPWSRRMTSEESSCFVWSKDALVCHATNQHNAMLIAAAPDLLKVAKLALEFIKEHAPDGDTYPMLAKAIAKAEGEEK